MKTVRSWLGSAVLTGTTSGPGLPEAELAVWHEKRGAQRRELSARDIHGAVKDPEDQTHGFTGTALKEFPGSKVWSTIGWTRQPRHGAAYVELAAGRKFVLVTFTTGHANERGIIPAVARTVIAGHRR